MSKIFCFSVWDKKAKVYMTPYFTAQPVFGLRAFEKMITDDDLDISRFKDDFELRLIGIFNSGSGIFEMNEIIETIAEGKQYLDDAV